MASGCLNGKWAKQFGVVANAVLWENAGGSDALCARQRWMEKGRSNNENHDMRKLRVL
jgi:hypothetical protein